MAKQNKFTYEGKTTGVKRTGFDGATLTEWSMSKSKKQKNGEWQVSGWLNFKSWLEEAKTLGDKENITVSGYIDVESWTGKDGKRQQKVVFVVNSISREGQTEGQYVPEEQHVNAITGEPIEQDSDLPF